MTDSQESRSHRNLENRKSVIAEMMGDSQSLASISQVFQISEGTVVTVCRHSALAASASNRRWYW